MNEIADQCNDKWHETLATLEFGNNLSSNNLVIIYQVTMKIT